MSGGPRLRLGDVQATLPDVVADNCIAGEAPTGSVRVYLKWFAKHSFFVVGSLSRACVKPWELKRYMWLYLQLW